ncbi:MAG: NUDIX domain-containing protein [Opitutales bacterium]|jgi:mutator protein MutT|nr:NUDIX domain-containing protein [bacterium]MDG2168800.1 NUDIX domain-containing protein [Opitutales bacterium]
MPEPKEIPYCPHCGAKTFHAGSFKPWHCTSCNFKLYPNIASAAGVFILDTQGRILMTERAHEPSIGKLGLPGGFLERGETAEEGLIREVEEEVGIPIEKLEYLCSSPNRYAFGGITYDTLDLFYTATTSATETIIDPEEVAAVHWMHAKDVKPKDLAFQSFLHAFKNLKKRIGEESIF